MSQIEEVKSKLDIIEVLSGYIKLSKSGSNFKAVCPFHSEKSPSFMVSPARQIWHCFGCGEGGDIFKFVMKIEGVEFGDALRSLANRAGVVLQRENPEIRTERNKLLDICKLATRYFQDSLKQNKNVLEYLKKRGLKEETIEEFKIGYGPESWDGLLKFLSAKNFQPQDIERAGLAVKNEKGRYFDRFRGRIMFPVANSNGEIVGFGGRIWEVESEEGKEKREEAKYINSPQTLIYDKSKVLYGFDKAKIDIRKNNFAILVEGYMDLIMSHQAGVLNAVAVSGTAMTRDHLHMLKRLSQNLRFSFDTDNAGDMATKRAIDMALADDFNVKIIVVPSAKDPADFILEHPEQWSKEVEKARDFLEFYFENAFARNDVELVSGKKNVAGILLAQIKKLKNKVEQSHWISVLAQKLKVKSSTLDEEMEKIRIDNFLPQDKNEEASSVVVKKGKQELLGERIAACILKSPDLRKCLDGLEIEPILGYPFAQLLDIIKKAPIDAKDAEKNLLSHIKAEAEHLSDYANQLMFSLEAAEEEIAFEDEVEFCLKELKAHLIKEQLNNISLKIHEAEESRDEKALSELMENFQSLSLRLNELLNQ